MTLPAPKLATDQVWQQAIAAGQIQSQTPANEELAKLTSLYLQTHPDHFQLSPEQVDQTKAAIVEWGKEAFPYLPNFLNHDQRLNLRDVMEFLQVKIAAQRNGAAI